LGCSSDGQSFFIIYNRKVNSKTLPRHYLNEESPAMRTSTITAEFASDVQTVWSVVTDNLHIDWRSDLASLDVSDDGNTFIEHTKGGFQTKFIITDKKPFEFYAFDMQNKNFDGHWTGTFSKTENNGAKIIFTEEVRIHNRVMEWLYYLFMDLKKMQATYVTDLRKRLGES
jgi:hypothetical protein